ncbi:MAG: hypothetical protein IKG56_02810 [Clostridia bacterium]|nr:hypothetical protein [Clostridia bacterium]
MKKEKNNLGITLIALVVTIIVLLILAGVTINIVAGNNSLLDKAKTSREYTEKAQIIETAQIDIMGRQAEKRGEISEEDLIEILTSDDYNTKGTLSDNGEESVLDKILTTKDGKYQIKVSDIYNGSFAKTALSLSQLKTKIEKQSEDCMIDEEGNIMPISVWRYQITGEDTCKIFGEEEMYGGPGQDALLYGYGRYNYLTGEFDNTEYKIPVYIWIEDKSYLVNEWGDYCFSFLPFSEISIPSHVEKLRN